MNDKLVINTIACVIMATLFIAMLLAANQQYLDAVMMVIRGFTVAMLATIGYGYAQRRTAK